MSDKSEFNVFLHKFKWVLGKYYSIKVRVRIVLMPLKSVVYFSVLRYLV